MGVKLSFGFPVYRKYLLHLGCVWFSVKYFSGVKYFSSENIFEKGKCFLVFGCILKIILENHFQCLVTF